MFQTKNRKLAMNTNRCVKWSREAQEFFDSAEDKSIILDIIISHWCISQTGEGFDELVNSINSEEIRKKIKKVNILDTSYLYRHCIPEFEKYSDTSLSTVWFLANKYTIEQLMVDYSINFWANEINNDIFEYWHKRMRTDFAGNENGVGTVQEFRDLIIKTAAIFSYKSNGVFSGCIDFLLEECAHACAYLSDKIVVYPISLSDTPIMFAIERYNLNTHQLSYKVSSSSQMRYKSHLKNSEKIDIEVASFMKNDVSNVNFFVVDKHGNFIYRNYAFNKIIGDITAEKLDQKSWEVSKEVMRYGKQIIG